MLTDVGPVEVAIPRDRDGSFELQIVRHWCSGCPPRGLTHGESCAHLAELYGARVSKQTISTITDGVIEGMRGSQNRPLDQVYPVMFIDAINVNIRDGNVANRPIYIALGVTVDGTRDVLGLWAGDDGDGEGSWCVTASKGLPAAIETVWPQAITQTCVIHLLRSSFRYASKKDWAAIAEDLKLVYTAASESAALDAFVAFSEKWEGDHQAMGERVGRAGLPVTAKRSTTATLSAGGCKDRACRCAPSPASRACRRRACSTGRHGRRPAPGCSTADWRRSAAGWDRRRRRRARRTARR